MKPQKLKTNKRFFNLAYYSLMRQFSVSIRESKHSQECVLIDERMNDFWGDFCEAVLGLDRDEVLKSMHKKLSPLLKEDFDLNDPMCINILYRAKLAEFCGANEMEFEDLYQLRNSTVQTYEKN